MRSLKSKLGKQASLFEFSAGVDDNLLARSARLGATPLHFAHHLGATDDMTEDHMLVVQPICFRGAYKELRAVGIRPRVGHGQSAETIVFQVKVLVVELLAIDGLSAGTIVIGKVAALAHLLKRSG